MSDTPFTDGNEIEYTTLAGERIKVVPSDQVRLLEAKLAAAEHELRGRETKIETLRAFIDAAKGD